MAGTTPPVAVVFNIVLRTLVIPKVEVVAEVSEALVANKVVAKKLVEVA